MFFKTNRRGFFQSLLGALTLGTHWANETARLSVGKTSTGIRVLGTVNPTSSVWELQRSIDGGKNWVTLPEEGSVIGSGRIRWDIPISPNDQVGIFRLKLSTVLKVGDKIHRIQAGKTLFASMMDLRTSTPSFSFNSEYRTDPGGQFVTEINGIKGKWVFEVNDQRINDSVDVGSSLYVPKSGDRIEWRLLA